MNLHNTVAVAIFQPFNFLSDDSHKKIIRHKCTSIKVPLNGSRTMECVYKKGDRTLTVYPFFPKK